MGTKLRAFATVFKMVGWKIKYGKRITIGFPQELPRTVISMDSKARIVLGKCIHAPYGELRLQAVESGALSVGSHVFFNMNSAVTAVESITIGDNCRFGNNLVIVDHDHNPDDLVGNDKENEFVSAPVSIGNGVWVGANVTILKGVTIGDNVVIAAGSVVRKDIPSDSVYYDKRDGVIVRKRNSVGETDVN